MTEDDLYIKMDRLRRKRKLATSPAWTVLGIIAFLDVIASIFLLIYLLW